MYYLMLFKGMWTNLIDETLVTILKRGHDYNLSGAYEFFFNLNRLLEGYCEYHNNLFVCCIDEVDKFVNIWQGYILHADYEEYSYESVVESYKNERFKQQPVKPRKRTTSFFYALINQIDNTQSTRKSINLMTSTRYRSWNQIIQKEISQTSRGKSAVKPVYELEKCNTDDMKQTLCYIVNQNFEKNEIFNDKDSIEILKQILKIYEGRPGLFVKLLSNIFKTKVESNFNSNNLFNALKENFQTLVEDAGRIIRSHFETFNEHKMKYPKQIELDLAEAIITCNGILWNTKDVGDLLSTVISRSGFFFGSKYKALKEDIFMSCIKQYYYNCIHDLDNYNNLFKSAVEHNEGIMEKEGSVEGYKQESLISISLLLHNYKTDIKELFDRGNQLNEIWKDRFLVLFNQIGDKDRLIIRNNVDKENFGENDLIKKMDHSFCLRGRSGVGKGVPDFTFFAYPYNPIKEDENNESYFEFINRLSIEKNDYIYYWFQE